MEWAGQQADALKAVGRWLKDRKGKQIFRLFGYAGSGKTTLAKEIASTVNGTVLFAAFTGKASLVLRKKGCDGARTIHSLIYKPVQDETTGIVTFKLNEESDIASAALVIIDEVSMVGEDLARDLMSFGTRILVLGDPAQLPPVRGEGFFINAEPDVMLTEIHRQAAESPIIRMSMDVREGRGLSVGAYGNCRVVARRDVAPEELREAVIGADQVLCGMNRTRQTYNRRIREIRGMTGTLASWQPARGDRLVCLKNDRVKGLLNGGLWDVGKVSHKARGKYGRLQMEVESVDQPGIAHVAVETPGEFFLGMEKDMDWRELREVDHFTYGNCLTVHKSQGSQWDDVLLFDESFVFRSDADKHLYTGLTRAAETITVVV